MSANAEAQNMKIQSVARYPLLIGAACAALFTVSSASAQNLFVSDFVNGNIDKITPDGTVSVFASGMNYPFGIAFNSHGDLFVANSALDNGTEGYITEITPTGSQSTFYSGIDPKAVAVDTAGNVFEADYHSGIIYEYTPGGVQSTFATGFDAPLALAFGKAGDLYVSDGYGNGAGRITKVKSNGTQTVIATGLSFPSFAFNKKGDMFVSNEGDGYIYEYTHDGAQSIFATVGGVYGGNNGLAFDDAGNLFVETGTGEIVEIAPDGTQSVFATIPGDPAGLAFQPAH